MEKELISIVIPVYNVENYLADCMEPVLEQTYSNIEIILVDDGSKDHSGVMCEKYKKKDGRVKVIHKLNGGLSDARNAGIEAAAGTFITFIDSDDTVDKSYCQALLDAIKRYHGDISVCRTVLFYDEIPWGIEGKENSVVYTRDEAFKAFLKGNLRATAWGKLYRRHIFDEIRYPKGKTTEDVYVISEVLSQCRTVVCGTDTNYYYRQRKDSIQNSKYVNTEDFLAAYRHSCDIIKNLQPKLKQDAQDRLIWAYFDAVNMMIKNGVSDERLGRYKAILKKNRTFLLKTKRKQRGRVLFFFYWESLYKKIYFYHIKRGKKPFVL